MVAAIFWEMKTTPLKTTRRVFVLWVAIHQQSAVLFTQNRPATSNQSAEPPAKRTGYTARAGFTLVE
jgi:hypothetical protein